MRKRLISLLLCFAMVLSVMPQAVFFAGAEEALPEAVAELAMQQEEMGEMPAVEESEQAEETETEPEAAAADEEESVKESAGEEAESAAEELLPEEEAAEETDTAEISEEEEDKAAPAEEDKSTAEDEELEVDLMAFEEYTITGIVVSNERYALYFDENGKPFMSDPSDLWSSALQISCQRDKSQICYMILDAPNANVIGKMAILTIDEDLSDDMIGCKVDITFTGAMNSNGTFSRVEVSDIKVNEDTVAYDVMSSDIEIMPNGESTSSALIKPYISFKTEDGEKRVEGRVDYALTNYGDCVEINNASYRVQKNTDYRGDIFAHRMIESIANISSNLECPYFNTPYITTTLDYNGKYQTQVDSFGAFANMGTNTLAKYRFISVDGGKTYSYIIYLGDIDYTIVNTLTDSTIAVAGSTGIKELGVEAEVIGEVKRGQSVIAYAKDGKLFVEPTTTVTGKATNLKDHTATIDGKVYVLDQSQFGEEIDTYFSTGYGVGMNNENTRYTVYKNIILEIEAGVSANPEDYAVILYSDYDWELGFVKVKVAFADNTEGTYVVSKIGGSDSENEQLKFYFANNLQMGALIRYKLADGRIDLSVNDKDIWQEKAGSGSDRIHESAILDWEGNVSASKSDARAYVENGKFYFGGYWGTSYRDSGDSIVFMLYGGTSDGNGGYGAIKAKACKLSEINDVAGEPGVVWAKIGTEASPATNFLPFYIGDVASDISESGLRTLTAGVMSVGEERALGVADEDNLAYVLSAKEAYNTDTNKWYMDVKLITKDGLLDTRTIDDVNYNDSIFTGNRVGADVIGMEPGSLVMFDTVPAKDGSGGEWISVITNNWGYGSISNMISNGANMGNYGYMGDGFYAVQIGIVEDDLIGFFPNSHAQNNATKASWADSMLTIKKDKYRFESIAIDGINFIEDGKIDTVNWYDNFSAGEYNAIMIIEGGKVVRVFSLHNNIEKENVTPPAEEPIEDLDPNDYAVILYSAYDAEMGVVTAKFGFADDTEGTYEISRIASREVDNNSLMPNFADNGMVGALVKVKIENGMADLTGNDAEVLREKNSSTLHSPYESVAKVYDGKFVITKDSYRRSYMGDDNSIVFMIYGGAVIGGGWEGEPGTIYSGLKSKAVKLKAIYDNVEEEVYFRTAGESIASGISGKYIGDAVAQLKSNGLTKLVAGVMSVGTRPVAGIVDEGSLAYVLSAKEAYNTETDKWFMDVKLITENGYLETRTIDDVNYNNSIFTGYQVGTHVSGMEPGSLVMFDTVPAKDGSGGEWISVITNNWGHGSISNMISNGANMGNYGYMGDGFYAVQIGIVEDDMIGFFPNLHSQNNASKYNWADSMLTIEKDKYRFKSIVIYDGEYYADAEIATVNWYDYVSAGEYNAIIIVEGGKVVRVFSLWDTYPEIKGDDSGEVNPGNPDNPVQPEQPEPVDKTKPYIEVGQVTCRAGDTVTVPVTIANNPGVLGIELNMAYAEGLTIDSVGQGDALDEMDFIPSGLMSMNPIKLMWDALEPDSENGNILNVTVTVPEDTKVGNYRIAMSPETIFNDSGEVDFGMIDGCINVVDYIPGDINGDGKVNTRDIVPLCRRIVGGYEYEELVEETLDVNRDGRINTRDVVELRRAITGGYDVVLKY